MEILCGDLLEMLCGPTYISACQQMNCLPRLFYPMKLSNLTVGLILPQVYEPETYSQEDEANYIRSHASESMGLGIYAPSVTFTNLRNITILGGCLWLTEGFLPAVKKDKSKVREPLAGCCDPV